MFGDPEFQAKSISGPRLTSLAQIAEHSVWQQNPSHPVRRSQRRNRKTRSGRRKRPPPPKEAVQWSPWESSAEWSHNHRAASKRSVSQRFRGVLAGNLWPDGDGEADGGGDVGGRDSRLSALKIKSLRSAMVSLDVGRSAGGRYFNKQTGPAVSSASCNRHNANQAPARALPLPRSSGE